MKKENMNINPSSKNFDDANNNSSEQKTFNPIETEICHSLPKTRLSNTSQSSNMFNRDNSGKQKIHSCIPSGYVSPALALRRQSKVDRVRDQVKEWRLKATSSGKFLRKMDGVDRIFQL